VASIDSAGADDVWISGPDLHLEPAQTAAQVSYAAYAQELFPVEDLVAIGPGGKEHLIDSSSQDNQSNEPHLVIKTH
jgi:hypothetical protein